MKFLLVTIGLAGIFLHIQASKNPFKFVNCMKDESQSILKINRFEVLPDPISLRKNFTASINIDILKDIPQNVSVKSKVYKVLSLPFGMDIDIPIPCIAGVGSCTLHHCEYVRLYHDQVCPFFPEGVECACPVKSGTFSGQNVDILVSDAGSLFKFLASGRYRIQMQLISKYSFKETMLACYTFTGEATS